MRESDPDRWDIFLLRRRQEEASQERTERPADPEVEDADEDDGSLFGCWEHRDLDEVADPHPSPAPSGGLGAVAPCEVEASKEPSARKPGRPEEANRGETAPRAIQPMSLVEHIRAVDMCEVFPPPRVSKEAMKYGLEVGDAMDITPGCDFNKESDWRKAEADVDEKEPLVLIGSPLPLCCI